MIDLGCILLTFAAHVLAALTHPSVARCPRGWYVNGVRPTGEYGCRPVQPETRPEWQADELYDHEVDSRVYCTGGSHPIVVNEVVGCQR